MSPWADLKLIDPDQAVAPMRVIVPVPVDGGFWQVIFQVAVLLPDIMKSVFLHDGSGPLPAGGCVHCVGEQTCWGGIGIDTPCIAIVGVTIQRSPVAWAKPVSEPSEQAAVATRYEIVRLFMS